MEIRITPSILTVDFADLAAEMRRVPGADGFHLDVMDNHFVPNLTFGLPVVRCLRQVSAQPFDLHLMIEDADRWAPIYAAESGAETVTFHVEASKAPIRLARELRRLGVRAAMGLKPATPIEPYADMITELDQILLMSVEPGFGGQKFLDVVVPKIRRTREIIRGSGAQIAIQIDGGISVETIGRCAEAGADVFVAGSAVYSAADPDAMVTELRKLAAAAYCGM
ncbi:MAG: ribulose-phosphate 3-epimerase [Propionibacteriaceae bacterium]|nr:ribulose-phosphate 3-epimerase [Propionibacteriaceae bacterium]